MSSSEARIGIKTLRQIQLEFEGLRSRLEEAEQTLDAIRSGEVDALVVFGERGEKVYTLKGADEPYRVFVEQMQDGAVTISKAGLILYCNQRMADLVAKPLEKVIGTQLQDLLESKHLSSFNNLLAAADEKPSLQEMSLGVTSGSAIPVLVSIAPLSGEVEDGYALTMTDLSFQKHHEQALREANEELEGFCYSVSHDLRTPLRSMISASRVLVEDFSEELSSEAQERLAKIETSALNLANLIDDLLSFARLGKRHIEPKTVDISKLSIQISTDSPDYQHVSFEIEQGLVGFGDESLLHLVLENLISNSAKFTRDSDHPKIWVGGKKIEEHQVFFVADNGIGFEMKYAERIFKPFERLHTNEEYPGTGIGLANVQRIVSRHEGKIWAESKPGERTTFYFYLGQTSPAVATV